jgi:hypothetical protein
LSRHRDTAATRARLRHRRSTSESIRSLPRPRDIAQRHRRAGPAFGQPHRPLIRDRYHGLARRRAPRATWRMAGLSRETNPIAAGRNTPRLRGVPPTRRVHPFEILQVVADSATKLVALREHHTEGERLCRQFVRVAKAYSNDHAPSDWKSVHTCDVRR